ncbi:MAG: FAD-dependent oxidoreductase [Bacillota bacterium]
MNEQQVQESLSPLQAAAESGRCLYCHDAPCVKGCPAGVDIPAFVKKVHSGNWRGAARVIREANVFGGSCARVCPTEELCEQECSSRLLGRSIPIGALQRLAWERGLAGTPGSANAGVATVAAPHGKGRRAAIVGAGPAGLAAAWELRSRGWDVTVLEAADKPGGQLDATIPVHRLPAEVVAAEVAAIVAAGVKVRTGVRVGRDVPAATLLAENDAVILAAGLGGGRPAEVQGQERKGLVAAEDFLAAARRGEVADLGGKRVVVIGGGNTAMDAAVTAAQARATRVTVVYRRTAREMPAWPREYRGALSAGAEFIWLAQPVAFEGESEGGPVASVRCVRMRLGAPDASGRAAPEPVPGSDFIIEADLVVMALGQGPNREVVESFGLKADAGGRPVADPSGRASQAKVFVAGDLRSGGATVVRAVAEGKKAARAAADDSREENG